MLFIAGFAHAQTDIKMSGDARVNANVMSKNNFYIANTTSSDADGSLTIWERYRQKTDFTVNENLKFRLGVRVDNFNNVNH
jgi:hypothetical protein